MKKQTAFICNVGLGIALYVALSLCLQVPFFENYYLCLGYVVMAVYCYYFGIAASVLVGALGCVLYCILINGLRGMPGWALGNVFIGIFLSMVFRQTGKMKNFKTFFCINVIAIIVASAIGILVIKSMTECFLYAQPFLVRVSKNIYAFISDAVVLVIGIPVAVMLKPFLRHFSKV